MSLMVGWLGTFFVDSGALCQGVEGGDISVCLIDTEKLCTHLCILYTGIVSDDLKNFLEFNLPKVKPGKTPKFQLGLVSEGLPLYCVAILPTYILAFSNSTD